MPRFNGQASSIGKSYIIVAASNSSSDFRDAADYTCDGVSDQTEINAAIVALGNSGGTVYLCPGNYYTSATISITSQNGVFLQGGGRRSVRIRPQAQTFPAITIEGVCVEWKLEDFTVDYTDAATPATNSLAVGILLGTVGGAGNYPYQFSIRNITLQYCYAGFYDPTAAFMYDMTNVYVATPYAYGFRKETVGGTTVTLINCYVNGVQSGTGFRFQAVDQIKLINCACDNLVTGGDALFLQSCRGSIDGFFAEGNTIVTGQAIIQMSGSILTIQGYKAVSNTYTPTVGLEAYGIRATDSSIITCIGPLSLTQTNSGAGTSYEIISGNNTFLLLGSSVAAASNTGGGASYATYTDNNNIGIISASTGLTSFSTLTSPSSPFIITSPSATSQLMDFRITSPFNSGSGTLSWNQTMQQTIEIANGATLAIGSSVTAKQSGMIFIVNDTDSTSAVFVLANGITALVSGSADWVASDTPVKNCLYVSAGNLLIKNNMGSNKFYNSYFLKWG